MLRSSRCRRIRICIRFDPHSPFFNEFTLAGYVIALEIENFGANAGFHLVSGDVAFDSRTVDLFDCIGFTFERRILSLFALSAGRSGIRQPPVVNCTFEHSESSPVPRRSTLSYKGLSLPGLW